MKILYFGGKKNGYMSGIIGQKLTSICDEVYEVKIGIGVKIK